MDITGDVVTAGGRTFRMMTLVVSGLCNAQIPVHVECQAEDYEMLLALYKRRAANLTAMFDEAGPKLVELLFGVDDAGLEARLDGSVLVSHCEVALLEDTLALSAGEFDERDMGRADFNEYASDNANMFQKLDTKYLPLAQKMSVNAAIARQHPLSSLFERYQPRRMNDKELAALSENEAKADALLVERLGYAEELLDGVPDDLGLRYRTAFAGYWTLRDDWITERPSRLICSARPELNKRRVALPVADERYGFLPSFSTIHLPFSGFPRPPISEEVEKRRQSRLQSLLEPLGSDRARVFNEMLSIVTVKELKDIVSGTHNVPALVCNHLENILQLKRGWLDEPAEQSTPVIVPEMLLGFPTAEENVLKPQGNSKRGRRQKVANGMQLADSTGVAERNRDEPMQAHAGPSGEIKRKKRATEAKIRVEKTPEAEIDSPAERRRLETYRLNLEMLTNPPGAKANFAGEMDWSIANVNKRLSGQTKITPDEVTLIEETFNLEEGWLEMVRPWSELPRRAQRRLSKELPTQQSEEALPPGSTHPA